jgi:hypothetical protein
MVTHRTRCCQRSSAGAVPSSDIYVEDRTRWPVITQIFTCRVENHLTYHQIAAQLNTDHELYPPPVPVRPEAAVGQWTWSAVRQMLQNPKYTGHQVWNRTTTRTGPTVRRKKSHRPNPIDQWVWSPTPTHPALVLAPLPVNGGDVLLSGIGATSDQDLAVT